MIESPDPRHRTARTPSPAGILSKSHRRPRRRTCSNPQCAPYLPICAALAISMTLLLVMSSVGVRHDHSRGTRPVRRRSCLPSESLRRPRRLLLVNLIQRHVAQGFTTGPHPAGYDVLLRVAVRTESSNGKHDMGLQGRIRSRRWELAGPWNIMLPHRQVGPTLMRSRPIADFNCSWFTASEPIHLEPNETYFCELVCRWGCFVIDNGVALGLTESDDEDASTLPGWSMADGFMIQNARFNRWWGDMVVGIDGFFHPNPEGPALRLAIRGEPREISGPGPGQSDDANTGPQPRESTARVGQVAAERFVETANAGVSVADRFRTHRDARIRGQRTGYEGGRTERRRARPVRLSGRVAGPERWPCRTRRRTTCTLCRREFWGECVPRPRRRECLPAWASLSANRSCGGTLAGATTADPSRTEEPGDRIRVRRVVGISGLLLSARPTQPRHRWR